MDTLAPGAELPYSKFTIQHSKCPEMTRLEVDLGPRSYPIFVGNGLLDGLVETLRVQGLRQIDAFVITNPQVGGLYFERVRGVLEGAGFRRVVRHDIPASEEGKNWDEFSATCAALLQ